MPTFSPEAFQAFGQKHLPGHLGIVVTRVETGLVAVELRVEEIHLAPNGYLHAGTVVTLADTAAGYGCISNLPENAKGFTTIELKSNFLGTAREGKISSEARLVHGGRTTQVWDAFVKNEASGKTIALFRCTQIILYP